MRAARRLALAPPARAWRGAAPVAPSSLLRGALGPRSSAASAGSPAEEAPQSSPAAARQPVCLYAARAGMAEATAEARKRCQMAAALGAMGFTGVLISAAQTVLTVSTRTLWTLAARHVERVSLLQPAAGQGAAPTPVDAEIESFAQAKEVHLRIESTNVVRELRLEEPNSPWEGARFQGLVEETRVPFRELCDRGALLYIDPESGDCCGHRQLLDALLTSEKVVADELMELRMDADEELRPPAKYMSIVVPSFKDLRPGELRSSSIGMALGGADTPAQASARLAQRSVMGGSLLLMTGLLFVGKDRGYDHSRSTDGAR
ncbi:unnamed protein product [Prorocentrum cordatum]|uniref:RING-type E3 ubiquitin transferase n=1 Tax=Prorocentrum cordatum TaxID=2364126 RepID=A0ABN9RH28_9DINO|nr:unnamed protein product [Polarella glacialis]